MCNRITSLVSVMLEDGRSNEPSVFLCAKFLCDSNRVGRFESNLWNPEENVFPEASW